MTVENSALPSTETVAVTAPTSVPNILEAPVIICWATSRRLMDASCCSTMVSTLESMPRL